MRSLDDIRSCQEVQQSQPPNSVNISVWSRCLVPKWWWKNSAECERQTAEFWLFAIDSEFVKMVWENKTGWLYAYKRCYGKKCPICKSFNVFIWDFIKSRAVGWVMEQFRILSMIYFLFSVVFFFAFSLCSTQISNVKNLDRLHTKN